jgi:hypothetical protein
MTTRTIGALLCGGVLVLVVIPDSFAQSRRNNTVHGNDIGTSRGVIVSPYQTSGHGGRRTKGTQGNPARKPGLSLNHEEIKVDYKEKGYKRPIGQKRGDR